MYFMQCTTPARLLSAQRLQSYPCNLMHSRDKYMQHHAGLLLRHFNHHRTACAHLSLAALPRSAAEQHAPFVTQGARAATLPAPLVSRSITQQRSTGAHTR